MRTLVRNISTGLYFEGPDKWTNHPSRALNFKSIDRAIKFIEKWRLKEMELAFAFNDLNYVTGVPLERVASKYSETED